MLWSQVLVTSMPVTIKPYTLLLSLSRYTLAILACSLAMSCNLEVHLHVQGCARLYIKLVVDQGACLKKKNICCEICFLAFRGCHRKYTTIIQRQNPTQVAYLAHAHIEDRNRGPPLDFAGDFNVVTENASLNLWIVRSGLYLLCIYHLPICADICLYVFFDYLPIANIC